MKVLRALGSLEAWLESAELSLRECAAERESCVAETEVAARLAELRLLRQEVERLHSHGHPHGPSLRARMETLEQK